MEVVFVFLFFAWYEALTLPLRAALVSVTAAPDVRRVVSRLAGPVVLLVPIFFLAHITDWGLHAIVGLSWIALLSASAFVLARRHARATSLSALLGYAADSNQGTVYRQVALDGVTLGLFLAFAWMRSWVPEMTTYVIDTSAAEKFMNSMMFWANWHATNLPPDDYWLSGHPLTYYYWGHFHWAWIGRVGGFPSELALNLAFARLVTMVFEAGYLLSRAVRLNTSWSVLAGLLVAWAGNPSAVHELWKVLQFSPQGWSWAAYNFWAPSRAIADSVIDEFPAFTAILGDFHAHHLALPWFLAWVSVTLLMLSRERGAVVAPGAADHFSGAYAKAVWAVLWLALGLSASLANLWNLPATGFVCLLVSAHAMLTRHEGRWTLLALALVLPLLVWASSRLLLGGGAEPLGVAATGSIWERLPIRWLPAELRSSPGQLFSMWGLPVLVLVSAGVLHALRHRERATVTTMLLGVALLAWSLSPLGAMLPGGSAWIWIAVAILTVSLHLGSRAWISGPCVYVLLCSYTVLAGLELVYVDDAFTGEYVRYNSYFKFSFPLWATCVVGAVAAGRSLWRANGQAGSALSTLNVVRAGLLLILSAALVYPTFAIPARLLKARMGDDPPRRPTLDAVAFIAHRPPFDVEAPMLAWIRQNVPPGQVVAEGRGRGAYGYVGRVASLAGRPVPLGWAHHEGQWRGGVGHRLTAERQADLDRLYGAATSDGVRDAARKLGVQWILFGIVERERYGKGEQESPVLQRLRESAAVAAAFPPKQPMVFLFDISEQGTQ